MPGSRSYLLCATPRTGSTLLCSLLSSTGVARHPESYFREQDLTWWARHFEGPVAGDGTFDFPRYASAVRRGSSSTNGVFGTRMMWESLQPTIAALSSRGATNSDLEVLVQALGPLKVLYLQREDTVGQAVSWARAQQTGYWQQGDEQIAEHYLDLELIDELLRTIEQHNRSWRAWFQQQRVEPHVVTYEDLTSDPAQTMQRVLQHLGLQAPKGWHPDSPHRQQANEVNAEWVRSYHAHRTAH